MRFFLNFILPMLLLSTLTAPADMHAQSGDQNYIDSFKKEIKRASPDSNKVKMIDNLIDMLPCTERPDYAEQAMAISKEINWHFGICISLQLLGEMNWICLNDQAKAIAYYKQLEQTAQKTNNLRWLKVAYFGLAYIYKDIGKYSEAIDQYNKTMKLNLGNAELMGTLSSLGQMYREIGNYQKSVVAYQQALTILNDTIIADKNIPDNFLLTKSGLLITLADVFIAMKDYDKALANYDLVLATNERIKNTTIQCLAGMGIGKCFILKNEAKKGIPYLEHSLDKAKRIGKEEEILNLMADAHYQAGNSEQALKYCYQAIAVATKRNIPPSLAHSYITLGKIYTDKHEYTRAVKYLNMAISITQETATMNEEKEAWETLSRAYTAMHKTDKAFDAYKKYIALRDTLYNADKARELTRLTMQGDFDRRQAADSVLQEEAKIRATQKLNRQKNYTYTGIAAVLILMGFSFVIMRERKKSDKLLLNILPGNVANELKAKGDVQAKRFENVTILFTDFVSFTTVSERLSPEGLVAELHACFKVFDEITARYGIEKIKTVGDAYLAAAGLPSPDPDHAEHVVLAAIEIRDFMAQRKKELGDDTFNIRVGINTGTVVAGIVGVKKFAYDIWGDAVNTAARMEQNSEAGKINISHNTYEIVKEKFACTYRGEHEAKNKGMLKMYFVEKLI